MTENFPHVELSVQMCSVNQTPTRKPTAPGHCYFSVSRSRNESNKTHDVETRKIKTVPDTNQGCNLVKSESSSTDNSLLVLTSHTSSSETDICESNTSKVKNKPLHPIKAGRSVDSCLVEITEECDEELNSRRNSVVRSVKIQLPKPVKLTRSNTWICSTDKDSTEKMPLQK